MHVLGPRRNTANQRLQAPAGRATVNQHVSSPTYPKGSQMTSTSTDLATMPRQEPTADPLADLTPPGDHGYDEAPQSVSRRC